MHKTKNRSSHLPNSSLCSISTSEGEKKAFVSAKASGQLHQMKMLFFSKPPTPPTHLTQEMFSVTTCSFALYLIYFSLSTFYLNSDIRPAPGCLSQTAVQRCDNAFFSSRAFYDLLFSSSFCSFFLFFPFQGLAHLTLNDQGMVQCFLF